MTLRNSIKKIQFFYFLKYRLDKDYRAQYQLMKTSSVKTIQEVAREMNMLEEYWGCKPLHYIRYGLFNLQLSDDQLKDYIPPYFHYTQYNERLFKGVDTHYFSNKLNLYNEFTKRGVNTPNVIAVIESDKIFSPDNKETTSITKLFENLPEGEKYFIKPVDGEGGTGIIVLKKVNGKILSNGRSVTDLLSLVDCKRTYVVQRGINQRDDLKKINTSSVNTLRTITQYKDGKASVKVCVMRIGRNGKDVDNSHQGGLSVQIDVNDGHYYPSATAEHGGGIIKEHPDSHFVFEGKYLDDWSNIRKSIEKYANLFPDIPEIAWDVAITNEGVEMIELNIGYGIDHLQCCCGGMRRVLSIYPDRKKHE